MNHFLLRIVFSLIGHSAAKFFIQMRHSVLTITVLRSDNSLPDKPRVRDSILKCINRSIYRECDFRHVAGLGGQNCFKFPGKFTESSLPGFCESFFRGLVV